MQRCRAEVELGQAVEAIGGGGDRRIDVDSVVHYLAGLSTHQGLSDIRHGSVLLCIFQLTH